MFFHCRLRTHVTFQLLRNNIVAVRKGTGNEIFPDNSCRWQLQSFSSNETFSRWRMREQVKLRFEFPHSQQQMEQTFFTPSYFFLYMKWDIFFWTYNGALWNLEIYWTVAQLESMDKASSPFGGIVAGGIFTWQLRPTQGVGVFRGNS